VVPILADRKEDIPMLVNYFVKQLSKFSGLKE
jgi:two-component system nitrogen regulation response regulator NtrX